jgi:hypothetical protein
MKHENIQNEESEEISKPERRKSCQISQGCDLPTSPLGVY